MRTAAAEFELDDCSLVVALTMVTTQKRVAPYAFAGVGTYRCYRETPSHPLTSKDDEFIRNVLLRTTLL